MCTIDSNIQSAKTVEIAVNLDKKSKTTVKKCVLLIDNPNLNDFFSGKRTWLTVIKPVYQRVSFSHDICIRIIQLTPFLKNQKKFRFLADSYLHLRCHPIYQF